MNNDLAGSQTNADHTVQFETIFRAHFKNLHGYACSILKDEFVAEEMVQNVFCRLWERKEKLKVAESYSAYLYRAVYNECLNYLRHNKIIATHRAHALQTGSEHDETDPAAIKELRQRIDKALNELPERCRTVFYLSRYEELSYREIGDKVGMSVRGVEKQISKALKLLRSHLADLMPVLVLLFINLKNLMS